MSDNARKWHVKRIFGKDSDGNENKDIYIDVLRIDELPAVLNADGQDITRKLSWQDDGADDENTSRTVKKIKITDPQNPPEDKNNPDQFIELKIIEKMSLNESDQEIGLKFFNDATDESGNAIDTARTVVKKRVYFAPTTGVDDRLNSGATVDADDYVRDETNKDKNQYLDVEVVVRSQTVEYHGGQDLTHIFNASIFEDDGQFPQDDRPTSNDDGTTPGDPVRLDPLQNVVNAQFLPNVQIVFAWTSGGGERKRYVKTLYGKPIRNGLFASGTPSDTLPQFPTDFRVGSSGTPKETDAQTTTLNTLLSGGGPLAKTNGFGRTWYVTTDTTVYAVNPKGQIKWTADISAFTHAVPPDFNTNSDPSFGQLPTLTQLNIAVASKAIYVGFQIQGSSISIDDEFGNHNFTTLIAVGYVGVNEKGQFLGGAIINGPDVSFSLTVDGDEHSYTGAFDVAIEPGVFPKS